MSVILVVAAHPDDEVLGCGGSIAAFSRSHDVHIVILGEGLSARSSRRGDADRAAIDALHAQAADVGHMLGAKSVTVEALPDNRFDEVAVLDIVKRVERVVDSLHPQIIYTQHPGDLNIDHSVTFRAVMTATRPTGGCSVEDVYTFEVASSTEWSFQQFQPTFRPNVFVDISHTIDAKIRAMEAYATEVRQFPHPRSSEALRVQARRWGAVVGMEYAEAFELVRSIRRVPADGLSATGGSR